MKKHSIVIFVGLIIFFILAHQPISLAAMVVVDTISQVTGLNVVEVIDFLNTIYYL